MNILAVSNKQFLPYLTVMLASLYENNRGSEIVTYIFHCDLLEQDLSLLQKQAERYGNTICPVKVDTKRLERLPAQKRWPLVLYSRMFAFELLPKTVDRILSIDVDIIVQKSLRELYDTELDGYSIAACEDTFTDTKVLKRMLNMNQSSRYFNAGVLLMNICKMREDSVTFDTFTEIAKAHGFMLANEDQDLFNLAFEKTKKLMNPACYNCSPDLFTKLSGNPDTRDEHFATILHYAGCCKPWDSYIFYTESELDRIWWAYAEKSPCYEKIRERFEQRLRDREDCKELRQTLTNVDLYYQTVIEWKFLEDSCGQDTLEKFFVDHKYFKIAVYGINPLQTLLCNELKSSQAVSVSFLVDSFKSGQKGQYEIRWAEDCDFKNVDLIVVAAFLHFDAIMKNIKDAPCPVVSLLALIERLLPDSFNQYV